MRTAVIKIPDQKFSLLKTIVRGLNGKIRTIDEDSVREEILARLVDAPLKDEEIVLEDIIRKDFKKHGVDLYK